MPILKQVPAPRPHRSMLTSESIANPLPHIPLGLLYLVLKEVDAKSHLAAISLVSRSWRQHAFPFLHRSMTVENLRHLKILADRLENETDADPLRVSLCLRTLNIDYPHYDFRLEKAEGVDHRFQSVAPMLAHLESLRVSARIDEDVSNLIRYFQVCPRLHKVSLTPMYNHLEFEST